MANQTLGGDRLMDEIRERMVTKACSFYVLVPAIPAKGLNTAAAAFAAPETGVPARTMAGALEREEAERKRAQMTTRSRLSQLLDQIRAEGGKAEGDVCDSDPVKAIDLALQEGPFDEIIISTLPLGASRWLGLDVPHRVERRFKVPVTTVTAKAG